MHGCFWHWHAPSKCRIAHTPKSNRRYWTRSSCGTANGISARGKPCAVWDGECSCYGNAKHATPPSYRPFYAAFWTVNCGTSLTSASTTGPAPGHRRSGPAGGSIPSSTAIKYERKLINIPGLGRHVAVAAVVGPRADGDLDLRPRDCPGGASPLALALEPLFLEREVDPQAAGGRVSRRSRPTTRWSISSCTRLPSIATIRARWSATKPRRLLMAIGPAPA